MTLIITAISVLGLIFSFKKEGLFQKIITIGLTISVLFLLTGDSNFLLGSLLLQLVLAITSVIYALIVKELKIIDRIAISSIGILFALGTLTIINHYPGQGLLRFALMIPIVLFLSTSIKHGLKQPKEFGFMVIWTTIAIMHLTIYLIKRL